METLPLILLTVLAGLVLTGAIRSARSRRARALAQVAADTIITETQSSHGVVRRAIATEGTSQQAAPAELRRRVANLASGTYIDDILAVQDSTLYRWPERLSNALRVYVEPTSAVAGWRPEYPQVARDVFGEWSEAGFPLAFAFVYDSTGADVTIRWRDRFPAEDGQRIGVTERTQTSTFLIARANITIATEDSSGRTLPATVVGGILRHEVGHALGLNHANDPTSVMYREAATAQIGVSDRTTLRLLYLVPGGRLR
ncbi:MAG: matrixin family metalloprotease [Gemmatimonadota bacterium]|nr:matrixin family metalloprotease [Gemmatimonadota bacterium]